MIIGINQRIVPALAGSLLHVDINWRPNQLPTSVTVWNLKCIYQRCPVRVQVSNFQRRHKLGAGHHQEVEIEEELELLVENLRGGAEDGEVSRQQRQRRGRHGFLSAGQDLDTRQCFLRHISRMETQHNEWRRKAGQISWITRTKVPPAANMLSITEHPLALHSSKVRFWIMLAIMSLASRHRLSVASRSIGGALRLMNPLTFGGKMHTAEPNLCVFNNSSPCSRRWEKSTSLTDSWHFMAQPKGGAS